MIDKEPAQSVSPVEADPRLLQLIGADFARERRVLPIKRVGALTIVAAQDMWARLDTVDELEAALGPITLVDFDPC